MPDEDEWLDVTFADLAPGDMTRLNSDARMFKVESVENGAFTLVRPPAVRQVGRPVLTKKCQVRIVRHGRKTKAGDRLAFVADDVKSLLQQQFDAEILSVYGDRPNARGFVPEVCVEKYTTQAMAAHMFIFHGQYIGEPPKDVELKKELFEFHKELHGKITELDRRSRLLHVHNQREFERLFK